MARNRGSEKALSDLNQRIKAAFFGTPIHRVGEMLMEVLVETTAAVDAGSAAPDQTRDAISYLGSLLESLPKSFGDRFAFDAALISAITEEWATGGGVAMSSMILPRYFSEWGHLTCTLPINKTQGHTVDVILIPGEDDLASIELLDYLWLCHELGHNLHFRRDSFAEGFLARLSDRVTLLRTRSVADRTTGRTAALSHIDLLISAWTPTANQKNWAHEIAADIAALWVLGPAFLAGFQRLLEETRPKPYHLNNEHPPYDVRASAIVDAAQRLRWSSNVAKIEQIQSNWRLSPHAEKRTSEYLALADDELVTAAVTNALAACQAAGLPRATPERVRELEDSFALGQSHEFGSELLITAWIADNRLAESEYDAWEVATNNELAATVKLECP